MMHRPGEEGEEREGEEDISEGRNGGSRTDT